MHLFGLFFVPLLLASRVCGDLLAVPALTMLPPCAADCVNSSVAATCPADDLTCLCLNTSFQVAMNDCVMTTCSVKESLSTKNFTLAACGVKSRDESREFRVSTIPVLVISAMFFAVRLLHRWLVLRTPLEQDDYMLITTAILCLATNLVNNLGVVRYGLGKDVWSVPVDHLYRFGMYFYISAVLYYLDLAFAKITLLMFYMRIFPARSTRLVLKCTAVFVACWGLLFALLTVFECRPVPYYWNQWDGEHEGQCMSGSGIAWANAALNIAVDVWMLIIPLVQLHKLQLHWKKKIGVGIMFCVGTFVTIVSILRLQSLIHFQKSTNITYDNMNIDKWSTIEVCTAMICICMPSARLFLVHFFPRIFGNSSAGNSTQAKSRFNMQSGTVRLGSASERERGDRGDLDPLDQIGQIGQLGQLGLDHHHTMDVLDPINDSRIRKNTKTTLAISASRGSDDDIHKDGGSIPMDPLPERHILRHTSYTVSSSHDADHHSHISQEHLAAGKTRSNDSASDTS